MSTLLKHFSLLILVLLVTIRIQAQPEPEATTLPEITADRVHPAWESFQPEFTPYVCPFHDVAPKYDPEEFICGYVLVPEDRTNPDSRLIKLSVLKIVSTSETPPGRAVIRLTGGPGGPSLSAGRITAYQRPDTARYREAADLIFFDQRGIGYSEAHFCRAVPRNFQYGVSTEEGGALLIEALKKCTAEARAEGIAIDAYSTWQNAMDVRDIRIALGYEQWTLFGVSYGTELGQAVIEVDEAGIRAAILDSVVPAEPLETGGWGAVSYGFRSALTALDAGCAENKRCARDVGDFSERFIASFEAYDADPLIIEDLDPGTFLDGRLVMDGTLAAGAVFQALYINTLYADFPSLLKALETRDETAIKAYVEVLGRRIDHSAGNGMEMVANCRGSSLVTDAEAAAMNAAEPELAKWMGTLAWTEICEQAYRIAPDPAVKTLVTDVPILIGAGTVDPITPPNYGQAILPGLANAQYVEFPHTGHGVFISHFDGCGGALWVAFVKDPMATLDTSCVANIQAPDFLTRVIETKGPYRFARDLQAGTYPIWLILAAAALLFALVAYPAGWLARHIQKTDAASLALARPLSWLGALISLLGLAWGIQMILTTATAHAMALPIGVLPATRWATWLTAIGFGLTAYALYRGVRSGAFGSRQIGTSIGLVATSLAAAGLLAFFLSLGIGLF